MKELTPQSVIEYCSPTEKRDKDFPKEVVYIRVNKRIVLLETSEKISLRQMFRLTKNEFSLMHQMGTADTGTLSLSGNPYDALGWWQKYITEADDTGVSPFTITIHSNHAGLIPTTEDNFYATCVTMSIIQHQFPMYDVHAFTPVEPEGS